MKKTELQFFGITDLLNKHEQIVMAIVYVHDYNSIFINKNYVLKFISLSSC